MLKKIQNWILPHVCILCQTICQNRDLCTACTNELPYCKTNCTRCGLHSPIAICGQCLKNPPSFDNTFALFEYKNPIDQLITGLKFHEKLIHARVLGELMAKALFQHYQHQSLPTCIVPVPLHKKRLQERGFNQSTLLGHPIAKQFNLPLLINVCERTRPTQAQSDLSLKERQYNIKGAFSLKKKITDRHIAILDDVTTTANTVNEISRLFKQQGARKITLWCIARSNIK